MPTFAEYLEKWLKQSTAQGLTNPLVKMPVKRFRLLQLDEFASFANGGALTIGTIADPIRSPNLKNRGRPLTSEYGLDAGSPTRLCRSRNEKPCLA
jgi:hypothetical protein